MGTKAGEEEIHRGMHRWRFPLFAGDDMGVVGEGGEPVVEVPCHIRVDLEVKEECEGRSRR